MENVVLLSKHAIIIASKKLVHRSLCIRLFVLRLKSGAWDDSCVFIYTTLSHINCCLPNGDSGLVGTLDVPVCITKVSRISVSCLDEMERTTSYRLMPEYMFKLALIKRKYDYVMSMIRNSNLWTGNDCLAAAEGLPRTGSSLNLAV
jgi:coatomer protein complex subunit alpha (xenin)